MGAALEGKWGQLYLNNNKKCGKIIKDIKKKKNPDKLELKVFITTKLALQLMLKVIFYVEKKRTKLEIKNMLKILVVKANL